MISGLWKRKAGNEDGEGEIGVLRVFREGLSGEVILKQGCKGIRHRILRGAFSQTREYSVRALDVQFVCEREEHLRKPSGCEPRGRCWERSSEKLLRACSWGPFRP